VPRKQLHLPLNYEYLVAEDQTLRVSLREQFELFRVDLDRLITFHRQEVSSLAPLMVSVFLSRGVRDISGRGNLRGARRFWRELQVLQHRLSDTLHFRGFGALRAGIPHQSIPMFGGAGVSRAQLECNFKVSCPVG